MSSTKHAALISGVAIAALFLATSMINGSQAWPLIWPLLGGTLAVKMASGSHEARASAGLGIGARAGLIAALLIFVVGTPLLYLVAGPTVEERLAGVLPLTGIALIAAVMLGLALLSLLLAAVGGALAIPFSRGRRTV